MTLNVNCIHYYRSLLRDRSSDEIGTALHNIIRTMKLVRHGRVCGEDFSNLDFGNIPLTNIDFSMNGTIPSSFDNSIISKWNFRSAGHYDGIIHAEFSKDGQFLITWGKDARVVVWSLHNQEPQLDCKFTSKPVDLVINSSNYHIPDAVQSFLDVNVKEKINNEMMDYEKKKALIRKFLKANENDIDIQQCISILSSNLHKDSYTSLFRIKSYSNDYAVIRQGFSFATHISCIAYIVEIKTGAVVDRYKQTSKNEPLEVIISPDNKYLCIGTYLTLAIYQMFSKRKVIDICSYFRPVYRVRVSLDLGLCLSLSFPNYPNNTNTTSEILWDLSEVMMIHKLSGKTKISFFPKESIQYNETIQWTDENSSIVKQEYNNNHSCFYKTTIHSSKHSFDIIYNYQKMFPRSDSVFYLVRKSGGIKRSISIKTYMKAQIIDGVLDGDEKYFIYLAKMDKRYIIVFFDISNRNEDIIELPFLQTTRCTSSAFSFYGEYLFLGLNDGTVLVVETKTGVIVRELYHTMSVNVKNCSFHNIEADDATFSLLHQYGAQIDDGKYKLGSPLVSADHD